MSLETTKQAADRRSQRERAIEAMHDAFYEYFAEQLVKNDSKYNRYRLHLATQFFDDMDLQKRMAPHFAAVATNPAEKQACARSAYWEAMLRHALTAMSSFEKEQLFRNDEDLEKRIVKIEKALKEPKETK